MPVRNDWGNRGEIADNPGITRRFGSVRCNIRCRRTCECCGIVTTAIPGCDTRFAFELVLGEGSADGLANDSVCPAAEPFGLGLRRRDRLRSRDELLDESIDQGHAGAPPEPQTRRLRLGRIAWGEPECLRGFRGGFQGRLRGSLVPSDEPTAAVAAEALPRNPLPDFRGLPRGGRVARGFPPGNRRGAGQRASRTGHRPVVDSRFIRSRFGPAGSCRETCSHGSDTSAFGAFAESSFHRAIDAADREAIARVAAYAFDTDSPAGRSSAE